MKIFEKAPAKINLSLDVFHKREDGYHEVEMVLTTIDLADRLEIQPWPRDEITLSGTSGYVPLNENNLVYRAARLLKERFDIRSGVHIRLEKRIPVAAGLGGGSSDAAAVLRGLNRLWNLGLSTKDLEKLGAELGSDVPFFVRGGTAIARGRGELLEPIDAPPACWVVLAKPAAGISTASVYARYHPGDKERTPATPAVVRAIRDGDFPALCRSLGNMLEDVTVELCPQVRKIKTCLLRMGADAALMSGSGPTVYALAAKQSKALRLKNGLRGFCRHVYLVRLLGQPEPETERLIPSVPR
ncbi:MAG: 4-(cytidine 5'-diphospho)-2-C-methyl-D-erythritol kinase [Candidatus Reconcilbacillus cellulovorans]|uniref:4-diphosphocytidyl-2-C-methyl-D-erythritol kinase n=1 Tax=Candidatus Reconcilbacillus cellulovorans TaxID=1906605 RepID=A0A2A6E1A0_9BACL|nr:MAG: 4-(cytidine 5'-diphospho)-2-C-methyl-D-erythritol kinase [Candidatus Reconcilbacillus cellulovorans]